MWPYNVDLLIPTLYLLPFARYSASKISVGDLDLSGSLKVKHFSFVWKPKGDIIMVVCWYKISVSDLDLSEFTESQIF